MHIHNVLALVGCLIAIQATSVSEAQPVDGEPTTALVIPTIDLPGDQTGLRAEIAGHSGLYLFDSGGGVTTMTPQSATILGCRSWGQVTGFRATGERMDTPRCDDVRLTIGGRKFLVPTASVLDLKRLVAPQMPSLAGLLALDVFAGQVITIRPVAHEVVVETSSSLQQRIAGATQVPARLVRDAEGLALTVDGAVQTSAGRAWMELDTGNGGPIMVDEHVAGLIGLTAGNRNIQQAAFDLVDGIPVQGAARVSSLIMDGDIGEAVLGKWDLTFDLKNGRAWLRPATSRPTPPR